MKTLRRISSILIVTIFLGLCACVGGGAIDGGGGEGNLPGGGAVGEGQPTIQPGGDHQPGTPIEPDDDKSASDDIAIPPPPPPTDDPDDPAGPSGLTI
jgi:hypothetical protein